MVPYVFFKEYYQDFPVSLNLSLLVLIHVMREAWVLSLLEMKQLGHGQQRPAHLHQSPSGKEFKV